ncbi:MAG: hypothetical protein HYZ42_06490 [Bacteroidetes bacterium]|nr:hypothetical protein [Bacteroidota bacterium]
MRGLAQYIIETEIPLLDFIDIIYAPHPIGMRFSWMLGGLCEKHQDYIYPAISYLFLNREAIKINQFNRSLAKMFKLVGIPPEIEGEAVNELFIWLQSADSNLSTKTYSLQALHKLTQQHNELKNELKLILEDLNYIDAPSFRSHADKVLKELK